MNTYNLIGGSIVIGVAVDDTIHFFHNFRNYYLKTGDVETAVVETLRSAGRALITTTLILVCCFWLRLFSPLKVISDFGLTVKGDQRLWPHNGILTAGRLSGRRDAGPCLAQCIVWRLQYQAARQSSRCYRVIGMV